MLSSLDNKGSNMEEVIDNWNKKNTEANKERRDNKSDFKNKLDDLFKGAGKNYYRREY